MKCITRLKQSIFIITTTHSPSLGRKKPPGRTILLHILPRREKIQWSLSCALVRLKI